MQTSQKSTLQTVAQFSKLKIVSRSSGSCDHNEEMIGEFELSSWLQRTLVFQGLSRSQLVSIVQIAQLQSLNKGELLFKQGSEATGFLLLKVDV